jgi:two-component system, NtrC family, sensor kinase
MVAQAGDFTFENSDLKEADWFKAALNNQYAISDVLQASSANPRCIVAASTQAEDSRWILKADIDFSSISSQLKNFGSENREAAFILNRRGELQTPQPENLTMAIDKYLRFFNKETYAGEFGNSKVILGFALLKNDDWVLIIQQDFDAAFSSMEFTRNVSALILVLSFLSILIMAFRLSGKMKKSAVKLDTAKNQIDSANDTVKRQIIESGSLASIGNWHPELPMKLTTRWPLWWKKPDGFRI